MARKRTQIAAEIDPLDDIDFEVMDAVKSGIKEGSAKGAKEGATKGFKEATAEKYFEMAKKVAAQQFNGENDPISKQIQSLEKMNQLEMMKATSDMIRGSKSQPIQNDNDENNYFQQLQLYLMTANESEKVIAQSYITQRYKPKEILAILTAMKQNGISPEEKAITSHGALSQRSNSMGFDLADQMKAIMQMKMINKMNEDEKPKQNDQNEILKLLVENMFKQQQNQQPTQNNNMEMTNMLISMMQQNQQALDKVREENQHLLLNKILPQLQPRSLVDELDQVQSSLGTLKTMGLIDPTGGRPLSDREIELKSRNEALLLELKKEELRMQQEATREANRANETQSMLSQLIPLGAEIIKSLKDIGKNPISEEERRRTIREKLLMKKEIENES